MKKLKLMILGMMISIGVKGTGDEDNFIKACERWDLPAVQAFIDAGADVNQTHFDRKTFLYIAVEGNIKYMDFYHNQTPENQEHISENLHDLIEILLRSGIDVNRTNTNYQIKHIGDKDIYYGGSKCPLHVAVESRNIKTVKLLLEYGANPNLWSCVSSLGTRLAVPATPLMIASYGGNIDAVRLLLSYGAIAREDFVWNPEREREENFSNNFSSPWEVLNRQYSKQAGFTALMYAWYNGNICDNLYTPSEKNKCREIACMLVNAGADPRILDKIREYHLEGNNSIKMSTASFHEYYTNHPWWGRRKNFMMVISGFNKLELEKKMTENSLESRVLAIPGLNQLITSYL